MKDGDQMVIVDVKADFAVSKMHTAGEKILINPSQLIIAITGKSQDGNSIIQFYDISAKIKIAATEICGAIDFLTWLDENSMGIVCRDSVYHYNLQAETLKKMFDRAEELSNHQIVSYTVSNDNLWASLNGIATDEYHTLVGTIQLYNFEKELKQIIKGF